MTTHSAIMSRLRKVETVQLEGSNAALYGDILFAALVERRQLAPVAKRLREAGIRYRDGSLALPRGEQTFTMSSTDDIQLLLQQLNLQDTDMGDTREGDNQMQYKPKSVQGLKKSFYVPTSTKRHS
ncbi:Hypothetical predicted protein [Pelobates cultripes]|uniref:Uncharacterized protein n=1 Tax=Pelobates cultripes TaxID=61616 RepID=A0AAD1VSY6_PELCU|nr:Hypothetical predicted protein [Pelobates cultripes]